MFNNNAIIKSKTKSKTKTKPKTKIKNIWKFSPSKQFSHDYIATLDIEDKRFQNIIEENLYGHKVIYIND